MLPPKDTWNDTVSGILPPDPENTRQKLLTLPSTCLYVTHVLKEVEGGKNVQNVVRAYHGGLLP